MLLFIALLWPVFFAFFGFCSSGGCWGCCYIDFVICIPFLKVPSVMEILLGSGLIPTYACKRGCLRFVFTCWAFLRFRSGPLLWYFGFLVEIERFFVFLAWGHIWFRVRISRLFLVWFTFWW